MSNLDFFFNPRSIAIIGSSPVPCKPSHIITEGLKNSGFKGLIYPVNPNHKEILGLKCYPDLRSIEESVDLAVFAISSDKIVRILKESAGILKGAIIISGGFSEIGEQGRILESELKDAASRNNVRIIGPNCMGIYDNISNVDALFISKERIKRPKKGKISILSQSGSFALTAMDEFASMGIGIARMVSYGNRMDVNESDCLKFLADDDETEVVVLYIEGIADGKRFVDAAGRCSEKKTVMAFKVGRAAAGVDAARSHTGSIAGRYEVYGAAFKKAGIIELDSYEEFIDGVKALSMQNSAKGRRVMIITDGGGMGVNIADAATERGMEVSPLPQDKKERLKKIFPPYFTVSNPLDLTGSVTDEWFKDALLKTMEGDFYDLAIVCSLWGPPLLTDKLPILLADAARGSGKPVIICSPGGDYTIKRKNLFEAQGLPVFFSPEAAVRGASMLIKKGAENLPPSPYPLPAGERRKVMNIDGFIKKASKEGRNLLFEPEVKEILKGIGISAPRGELIKEYKDAVRVAPTIGYPLILKVVSEEITHKTDVGGVSAIIRSEDDMESAWMELIMSVADKMPGVVIEGCLLEEFLPKGVEVIVGCVRDEQFGGVVMFGMGGVSVELTKDVSFRLAPVTKNEALEMMKDVKGYPLLDGFRGCSFDINGVAEAIVKLSHLMDEAEEIKEIEINPLIVYERGIVAVDARLMFK